MIETWKTVVVSIICVAGWVGIATIIAISIFTIGVVIFAKTKP